MFGYVLLGGNKLKSFFWGTETPEWYECVVLYSAEALEHEVVGLHFRVLACRTSLSSDVEKALTPEDNIMVSKCQYKIDTRQKIGRHVSLTAPALFDLSSMNPEEAEQVMELEVEQMMQEEEENANDYKSKLLDSDDMAWWEKENNNGEGPVDCGFFYEAEVFGGKFIDDDQENIQPDQESPVLINRNESFGGSYLKKTTSMRHHMLEEMINELTMSNLEKRIASASAPLRNKTPSQRGVVLETGLEGDWEFNFDDDKHIDLGDNSSIASVDDDDIHEMFVDECSVRSDALRRGQAHTEPNLSGLGSFDSECGGLERLPAFISTRGKEKEIWMTYREEITATWKADLAELRAGLGMN